jgi:hypothetical protein
MYFLGLSAAIAMMSLAAGASEIRPGTITVVASGDDDAADSVTKIYADAVEHALLRTPFVLLPNPSHSRYIATVEVSQIPRGVVMPGGRRSATAPKLTYGGGGLSLSLPSKKTQLRGLIETRLKVSVSLRNNDHVAWAGEAITVRASGTKGGDTSVVATTLSDALLTQFPKHLQAPLSIP